MQMWVSRNEVILPCASTMLVTQATPCELPYSVLYYTPTIMKSHTIYTMG
jgi:hypothetical protein